MKSFKVIAALGIAAFVAGGCSGSSSSKQATARRPDTASDPQVVRELNGAVDAMQRVHSYRFVATVQTDRDATVARGEFEAPDRVHQTISVGDRTGAELVVSGTRMVVKDPRTGAWRDGQRGAGAGASDPRAAFTTLGRARNVHKDGQAYLFTLSGEGAAALAKGTDVTAGTVTGAVVVTGGRISSLDYSLDGRGRTVRVRIAYSDFDVAPPVAVPA